LCAVDGWAGGQGPGSRRARARTRARPAGAPAGPAARWRGSASPSAAPLTGCTPATGCCWPRPRSSAPAACSSGSLVRLRGHALAHAQLEPSRLARARSSGAGHRLHVRRACMLSRSQHGVRRGGRPWPRSAGPAGGHACASAALPRAARRRAAAGAEARGGVAGGLRGALRRRRGLCARRAAGPGGDHRRAAGPQGAPARRAQALCCVRETPRRPVQ